MEEIKIDKELFLLYQKYKKIENDTIKELEEINKKDKINKDKKLTELIQISKILYKIYKLNKEIDKYYNNAFFNTNIKEIDNKRENIILLEKINYTYYKNKNSKLLGLICSKIGATKKQLNEQIKKELQNLNIYVEK